ncbi:hypothetical protein Hypma_014565 [Hypsizygus marmoreus]|uniref:F-box domain-containing protein n=1 Tax=Hypsizygus marmoreus TaxID=39966 RepID=A0A369JEH9_HYPMA|nr:hypothetical protein Hypma_014565 [Hypsizygus marmoreus]
MSTISEYQRLLQLLLTHEPQRSDYILSPSVHQEFREMRGRLRILLERFDFDSSIDTAIQPPTEMSLDQQQPTHPLCIWLIQNISFSIAPHKRLPAEIWSEIFMTVTPWHMLFPPDRSDHLLPSSATPVTPTTVWTLMQVCSRWRQIAKTTPDLWRNVTISHDPSCRTPRDRWADRIRRIVEVSGGFLSRGTLFLSISIIVGSLEPYSAEEESLQYLVRDANPVWDIISPISRQLLSLNINSSSGLFWRFLESGPLPFDSLRSVTLDLHPLSHPLSHPFDTSRFTNVTTFSDAPRLQSLCLNRNNVPDTSFRPGALSDLHEFQLPWGHLTMVMLQDVWTTPVACYAILSQCPNLSASALWVTFTELEIPFNIASHLPTHESLTHHGLRWISFHFDFPATGPYFPDGFLRPLAFPSLNSLFINTELSSHDMIESSILSLLRRSECKLEQFSLSWGKVDDEDALIVHPDLHAVLDHLSPTLESLTLYSWHITHDVLDLMMRRCLLPKLTYLACYLESWECLSLFLDMVEARTQASDIHPILNYISTFFSATPQIDEFSKQVKERAISAMEVANEEGRRFDIIGLHEY